MEGSGNPRRGVMPAAGALRAPHSDRREALRSRGALAVIALMLLSSLGLSTGSWGAGGEGGPSCLVDGRAHGASQASGPPAPGKPSLRTVTVKVAADSRLRNNEIWKVDISRHLGDVNMYFRGLIGIKFKIVAFEYWDAGPEGRPLIALLPGLRDHAGRSGPQGRGAEIVLGVVSEGPEGPVNPGIADYLNGIVIVKYLTRKSGISYVLLHEFCHLFGAVDLRDRGSVMSLERPAFRIDAFTRSIMSVNRDRRFWPGENPLSSDRMAEAISIYSRRASLGKGEDDLAVCLGHLKSLLARSGIQASLR